MYIETDLKQAGHAQLKFKLLFIVLLLLSTLMPDLARSDAGNKVTDKSACMAVATSAHESCGYAVQADYWIEHARCLNESGRLNRRTCITRAREQLAESGSDCRHQFKARQQICGMTRENFYLPDIKSADFMTAEQIRQNPNPYFPLTPGLTLKYREGHETIVVTVTDRVVPIMGVETIAVTDVVQIDGVDVEVTEDWYAQDKQGNVWYFGEISRNFENGLLSDLEGSWRAGRNGAQPGIIMQAHPRPGSVYRQEYLVGEAEDMAEVIGVKQSGESVPAADCRGGCLVVREFLPLEPEVEEDKYYVAGIGFVLGIDRVSGTRAELVSIQQH